MENKKTTTGVLKAIAKEIKEKSNGDIKYWTFGIMIDDEWYNYTNTIKDAVEDNHEKCQENKNKMVTINYQQMKNYKKLLGINLVEGGEEMKVKTEKVGEPDWDKIKEDKQDRIFKGQCFNNATILFANGDITFKPKEAPKLIFELAELLYQEGLKIGWNK